MQLWVVLLGLCALSAAAPQNWPYRDSLMPYRYGYPGQSQYKYLPQVEDDEETGPFYSGLHGRQDLVVGSEGDRVKPTSEPGVSVVETGSVAPVVEPSKNPKPSQSSPTSRPVGVDTGRPVQPPPFPAARPPPSPPPKPEEENEEDDESEEDADDDVEGDADEEEEQADEGEDADADEDANETEDDEEEERRRQEPLFIVKDEKTEAVSAAPVAHPAVIASTAAPAVVSARPVVNQTAAANGTHAKPVEGEVDASSEEQDSPAGIEALVPGYVTEHGEVLVPVDTVTGDRPISIIPDPYATPSRGVSLSRGPTYRGPYEDSDDYETPYYFSDVYGGVRRQDDSDEVNSEVNGVVPVTKGQGKVPVDEKNQVSESEGVDETETDDEDVVQVEEGSTKDPDSLEAELEGRNEYLTSFVPSRTPALYAVIKSRIPVDSSSEYEDYVPPQQYQYNGPYNNDYQPRRPQPRPYYYRPRPYYQQQQPPSQSVSLAVMLSGQQGNNNRRFPPQPVYQPYPYGQGYEDSQEYVRPIPSQFLRRPVPPVYRPNQFGGYQQLSYRPNQFSGYQQGGYRPNQFPGYQQGGGGYRPNQFSSYQQKPQFTIYNGPVYRPFGNGQNHVGAGAKPTGLRRPVQGNKQSPAIAYLRPTGVKITPLRRPTQVIKQKKHPVESQEPILYADSTDNSSGSQDSFEIIPNIQRDGKVTIPKTRRAAKMAKKPSKKLLESKKATSNPDPLHILKKINANAKRS